jgi:hypothetical protein
LGNGPPLVLVNPTRVAKAIIGVYTVANVFDIMALSVFLNGAPFPVQTGIAAPTTAAESLLQSNQNLQITNGSDSDG